MLGSGVGQLPANSSPGAAMSRLFLARAVLAFALALCTASTASADPPRAERLVNRAMVQADREAVRLLRLLDESRRARDVARIACVDRSLSQVNSLSRMLDFRRDRIRAAHARGDRAQVRHEQRVLVHMIQEIRRVAREGRACVNPASGQPDHTTVEVLIHPDVRHHEDLRPTPTPRR